MIQGGTGQDGQTSVAFVEQVELGGALVLRHGETSFNAASDGIIGGLYSGSTLLANCFAGFRIAPSGSQSTIQALVNGALVGTAMTTVAGHRYALTTRLYASEIFRKQQIFHSSLYPAGTGRGGVAIPADVRVVLEVHDIDPANAGSLQAISTVLYDDIVTPAPGYCGYALVDSSQPAHLHQLCAIASGYGGPGAQRAAGGGLSHASGRRPGRRCRVHH